MKQFAVLGLGRFGTSLALSLMSMGNQVLGIDVDEERVNLLADELTHAVIVDMTDGASLKALGLGNMDAVLVCTGDVQTSIMTTVLLKDMGVKKVICKANDDLHERILLKVGADQVVFPERDRGQRLAYAVAQSSVIEYIELSKEYSLAEVRVLQEWKGKTLIEANIRAKYGLNVVAIRRQGGIMVSPRGDVAMEAEDVLVVIGKNSDISALG